MCDQSPDDLLPVGDQDLTQMGVELVKIFRSLDADGRLQLLRVARSLLNGGWDGRSSDDDGGRASNMQ